METAHHVLKNGRTLAYVQTGDPNGIPVFYGHGGPGSRLEASWFQDVASRKGFRIIATDRPGFGESTRFTYGRARGIWRPMTIWMKYSIWPEAKCKADVGPRGSVT